MANYDNLPVFKASYDLLLKIYGLGQHWNRDIKYTLGEILKKELSQVLISIYHANSTRLKAECIDKAREGMVLVKINLRLLKDLSQLSIKQYAYLCEMAESISKQLAAWEKSQRSKEEQN